jgi:hypothetical protein
LFFKTTKILLANVTFSCRSVKLAIQSAGVNLNQNIKFSTHASGSIQRYQYVVVLSTPIFVANVDFISLFGLFPSFFFRKNLFLILEKEIVTPWRPFQRQESS